MDSDDKIISFDKFIKKQKEHKQEIQNQWKDTEYIESIDDIDKIAKKKVKTDLISMEIKSDYFKQEEAKLKYVEKKPFNPLEAFLSMFGKMNTSNPRLQSLPSSDYSFVIINNISEFNKKYFKQIVKSSYSICGMCSEGKYKKSLKIFKPYLIDIFINQEDPIKNLSFFDMLDFRFKTMFVFNKIKYPDLALNQKTGLLPILPRLFNQFRRRAEYLLKNLHRFFNRFSEKIPKRLHKSLTIIYDSCLCSIKLKDKNYLFYGFFEWLKVVRCQFNFLKWI